VGSTEREARQPFSSFRRFLVNHSPSPSVVQAEALQQSLFSKGITDMRRTHFLPCLLRCTASSFVLIASLAAAQTEPVKPAPPARPAATAKPTAEAAPVNDQEVAASQEELLKLLRLSPTLTSVIEHDPSLLSNQDYVNHNNPQLGQFLINHPEVARNPEFYLFSHLDGERNRDHALQRAVWPELDQRPSGTNVEEIVEKISVLAGFVCFFGAVVWIIRQLLEHRRWSRIFKLQNDVHCRLIDKFSSSQELAAYMGTEAGRRFLEAAPISAGIEPEQRVPNAVARVLTPLQIGIVLVLLGIGLLLLRHVGTDTQAPMLVFGTVVLMPGLGFIISAGVTWVLAARLGLMPDIPPSSSSTNPPYNPGESR
jgi:hypothetical protein